ncbi:MAG: tRNA pseudouridine(55) synthase TruB [Methyloligellaceae bacterium]
MARRKGNPVNGWLVLDKDEGITSTQAVGKARRIFNAQKAGHAGTLDPLATGILPIAFGEATKTVPYLMDSEKTYRFTIAWGAETDTDDEQGTVVARNDERPEPSAVEEAIKSFVGDIMQVPPQYSAIKVDGARAYDLAREGEEFELKARQIRIDRLEITVCEQDFCVLEADCGKGTYVRSIARDLGRQLGCLGHITQLRRTRVGIFRENDAISFDKILETQEELRQSGAEPAILTEQLRPVETALDDIPALAVDGNDAQRLKRGQSVLIRGRDAPIIKGPCYAISRGVLVALGEVIRGELKPTRVFNLP